MSEGKSSPKIPLAAAAFCVVFRIPHVAVGIMATWAAVRLYQEFEAASAPTTKPREQRAHAPSLHSEDKRLRKKSHGVKHKKFML